MGYSDVEGDTELPGFSRSFSPEKVHHPHLVMEVEKAMEEAVDKVKVVMDEINPDIGYHGREGQIIDIEFDDASSVTGQPEDIFLYTVKLENGEVPDIHFRWKKLNKVEEGG